MSSERRVAGESEEAADRQLGSRCRAELDVAQPGEARDRRRQRHAGADESLEGLGDLESPNARRADLADPVARGGQSRGLEVEDDERRVLDDDLFAASVGEPDPRTEPGEPRVALDDVREQRVGERRRRPLERKQRPSGVLGSDRSPPRLDQLDEAVGGVERELHAQSLYEHMFV